MTPQLRGIDLFGSRLEHNVGGEASLDHPRRGQRHRGVLGERRLHLAQLHPYTAQLHLRVSASEELEPAACREPHEVARQIEPPPRLRERVRHEARRRGSRPAEIAAGESRASEGQLPRGTERRGSARSGPSPFEHHGTNARGWLADGGDRASVGLRSGARRDVDRRLGRPVLVEEPACGQGVRGTIADRGRKRLAAGKEVAESLESLPVGLVEKRREHRGHEMGGGEAFASE